MPFKREPIVEGNPIPENERTCQVSLDYKQAYYEVLEMAMRKDEEIRELREIVKLLSKRL